MGALYIAIPNSSHQPSVIATGTAIKTLVQVATPSTTNIRIAGWGVSFKGTSGAPGEVSLVDVDVAATVTSLTPLDWENADNQDSLCVGGTSATGHTGTAEGSITASRILDAQAVNPQTGYSIWFPRRPLVKASRFLRIRVLFAADVNCIPWIVWEEPA